ncbi:MAG TPA: GYF domain-containing protein [Polyangiaceae bacterium]|nr:GYF domain-containing protein [Polyangiaceae bacterium]
MSESLSIDEGWEEPLDSEQVTHVKGEAVTGTAALGEWLVNVSEQVVVPMTTTDVVDALRSQRITVRSLVWRTGMQDWTPLGEVPPLRLAAGPLAAQPARPAAAALAPLPILPPRATPKERPAPAAPERLLHPPPKEPARAARDERRRRNTLPFGFPVVRDPASVRQPMGLHAHSGAPAVASNEPSARAGRDEVEALAIYERATPSLTFSDSVRAEWQGTAGLVHQPAQKVATVSAAPAPRPETKLEPKPRLSLEPQSDPKPRLSLEPQSDPMQSARVEARPQLSGSQPPSSLAPTTSEPENELPARGAGLWGDLSVVLASDLRAAQASSKRITLIASLGSAALASVLTLWVAHSSLHRSREAAPAARTAAAAAEAPPPKVEVAAAPAPTPEVVALPSASSTPTAPTPSAHPIQSPLPSSPVVAVHVAVKAPTMSAPPRVVSKPKAPTADADSDSPNVTTDPNPYSDAPEHTAPKTPTAAFKETPSAAAAPKPDTDSVTPSVASGLEDGAKQARPAPTTTPGF